jgi:hypothetical protein
MRLHVPKLPLFQVDTVALAGTWFCPDRTQGCWMQEPGKAGFSESTTKAN